MKDNKIQIFNSLHDQYRALGLPITQMDLSMDFTILNLNSTFKNILPFRIPTQRLNFFVFNFTKQGCGQYTIDDQTFHINPGTVYFTNPGHYRSSEWSNTDEVYLITLSESFLKENVHPHIFDEFPFLLTEIFPGRRVKPEAFADLENIYLNIYKEYNNCSKFRKRIIANLFVVLLLKIKELVLTDYNPMDDSHRSAMIVKDFKRLLEKHYRELSAGKVEKLFRLQDYANLQNLHPNYFSKVIKTETGKSIGTWIAEKTMTEAKSLLHHSSVPVKEIAYRLGFAETAHFSNYFKKHTDLSPADYRREQSGTPPLNFATIA